MNMWICATWASGRTKAKTRLEGLLHPQPPPTSSSSSAVILLLSLSLFLSRSLALRVCRCSMYCTPMCTQPCSIRFDVCGIDAERGRVPVYWLTLSSLASDSSYVGFPSQYVRDASFDSFASLSAQNESLSLRYSWPRQSDPARAWRFNFLRDVNPLLRLQDCPLFFPSLLFLFNGTVQFFTHRSIRHRVALKVDEPFAWKR